MSVLSPIDAVAHALYNRDQIKGETSPRELLSWGTLLSDDQIRYQKDATHIIRTFQAAYARSELDYELTQATTQYKADCVTTPLNRVKNFFGL